MLPKCGLASSDIFSYLLSTQLLEFDESKTANSPQESDDDKSSKKVE